MDAYVHVVSLARPENREAVLKEFDTTGLRCFLDGSSVRSLREFYTAVAESVPLIAGFGKNADALFDLFSSFGDYKHFGKRHLFVWYLPEQMLEGDPENFAKVADIIVAAAKELLVGDELDAEAETEPGWMPTRLEVVFLCIDSSEAERIASMVSRLSNFWGNTFIDLDVQVSFVRA